MKCQDYSIVRYYARARQKNRIMRKGLDLTQAQEHCSDPLTQKAHVWFDGYTRECNCKKS